MSHHVRSIVAASLVGVASTAWLAYAPTAAADPTPAAVDCTAFAEPVYQVLKPSNDASLLTPWVGERVSAASYGFTKDDGALFRASTRPAPGLIPVSRLYRANPQEFRVTTDPQTLTAGDGSGYVDEGTSFYASPTAASCLAPVVSYVKGDSHRLALTDAEQAALTDDGWTKAEVAFYAAPTQPVSTEPAPPPPVSRPAPADGAFSFAVIPDTQLEVVRSSDPRMVNRAAWLAKQKDLRFVAQTGDLVNWDTPDHAQYQVAKTGMTVLHDAGIPYTVAIGNHDTQATGVGGSARDPKRTYQLQRDTSTFNDYFSATDYGAVDGVYEKGKVDNLYALYTAGGLKWMVLDLEFCARPGVVDWAKSVVASHPDYNVIVSTHSYENAAGGIDPSDQGYGDTSGQQLFDQLISQYSNIKMVFSGHVGYAQKARVDTGKDGNKIYSFLTTFHDPKTNPVRMMAVDPQAGTVTTSLYAPYTDQRWPEYAETLRGVDFVR